MKNRVIKYAILVGIISLTIIVNIFCKSVVGTSDEAELSETVSIADEGTEHSVMVKAPWGEVLKREASDISEEEYRELAVYLAECEDEKLFEDMLKACYDYREKAEYRNGGGFVTTRVVYESPEKIEKFAEAMTNLSEEWQEEQGLGYTREENRSVFRAVQYALVLQKIAQNKEIVVVSQCTPTGERRELLDDLFEISYDARTFAITATLCPYEEKFFLSYCDYRLEKNNKIQYIVSYPAIGASAWSEMQEEESTYNLVFGKEEPLSQRLGLMFSTFQLVYVSVVTDDGDIEHEYAMYESVETAGWIEAFNQYMQSEEGKYLASSIGYRNFPDGELTAKYLMENYEEVAIIVNWIEEDYMYRTNFFLEIDDIYRDMADESE